MERGQFTFYASIYESARRIKNKNARADFYDAICEYALNGTVPDLDKLSDAAAIGFISARPNLDTSRRKAKSGKAGGMAKQSGSKTEANAIKDEANSKQTASEKEIEKEKEIEIEYECIKAQDAPLQAKRKHGVYKWVKLTDEEYDRLVSDLGQEETDRCIAYVDELAQSTGNKNKWKDWNLVVRKCSRDHWGAKSYTVTKKDVPKGNGELGTAELEAIQKLLITP